MSTSTLLGLKDERMPFWRIALHDSIDDAPPRIGLLRALDQEAAEQTAQHLTWPDRRCDLWPIVPGAGRIPDMGQVLWEDDPG
jgi:hypothetical protein